jgi:tetratricopeptide (TPR) repeat protein
MAFRRRFRASALTLGSAIGASASHFSGEGSAMRFAFLPNRRFVVGSALMVAISAFTHGMVRGQEDAATPAADASATTETASEAAAPAEGEATQRPAQEIFQEILEKRNEILTSGNKALQTGDFQTALQLFDQLAQAGDYFYNASGFNQGYEQLKLIGYTGRAQAYAGMKEYEAALDEFKAIFEANENFAPALLARGKMYLDLGIPDGYGQALADYQKAVKAQRGNLNAQFGLGKVLILTNNYQAGIGPLTKVIDNAPNKDAPELAEAYRLRGTGFAGTLKMPEALQDLNKSLSLNPNDYETYVALGAIDFRNEDYQGALDQFAKAIEHYKPKDPEDKLPFIQGILTRATAYMELGRVAKSAAAKQAAYEGARLEAEKVLSYLDPKHPSHAGMRATALYSRAIAERMLGQLNQAVQTLSEAIEINPNQSEAYYRRGICYHYLGDDRLAIADFTEASNINFNDPRAALWLGFTHAKMGNYLDALRAYSDAIAVSDRFTPAYINRGLAYMAIREYDKALADFNDAVRLEPTNSDYYYKRGLAYEALGQYQKASESFAAAVEFNSNHAAAYRHLADAMQRLGRANLAAQYRQRATELAAPKKAG